MADNSNIGTGIKISQLDWAANVVPDNYTVLVQSNNGELKTTKAKIRDLLAGVGRQDATIEGRVVSLEEKTSILSGNLNTANSRISSINTDLQNSNSQTEEKFKNLYQTVYGSDDPHGSEGLIGDINELNTKLEEKLGTLSTLIEDPDLIDKLTNLLDQLSGTDLSNSILDLVEQINESVDKIDSLETNVDSLLNDSEAISKKLDGIYNSNTKNLLNLPLALNENEDYFDFNPIIIENDSIDPEYAWIDRYCFGNSALGTNLSIDVNTREILSVNQANELCDMPGLQTFELEGIPLRAGMFDSGSIRLKTRGDCNVKIYLNDAAFSTSEDCILNVSINNDMVSKKKLKRNVSGSDIDLNLIWNGFLESDSTIDFDIDDSASDTAYDNISINNLVGMIIPTLNSYEIDALNSTEIEILSAYHGNVESTIIIDVGINGGINNQSFQLSGVFYGNSDPETKDLESSIMMNISPRTNFANNAEITSLNNTSDVSAIQIISYNEITNKTISSDIYEL